MQVADLIEDKALLGYFDNEGTHNETWVAISDLELVHKVEGGWIK